MQTIEHLHRPDDLILSFDQVKQQVRWLSGVMPVEHDMCMNSCMAFTGPHEMLNKCSQCKHLGTVLAQLRLKSGSQPYQSGL